MEITIRKFSGGKKLSLLEEIGHDPYLAVLLIICHPSQFIPNLFLYLRNLLKAN